MTILSETLSNQLYASSSFEDISLFDKNIKVQQINYHIIDSPISQILAAEYEGGICLLIFIQNENIDNSIADLTKRFRPIKTILNKTPILEKCEQQLHEYFANQRTHFTLKLSIFGTEFQKQVWATLSHIEYGSTISYQTQSINMGNPKAIRAIASANGANPISIIIPCHRVIGKNGDLTGYAGGLATKKWLLEHEQQRKI